MGTPSNLSICFRPFSDYKIWTLLMHYKKRIIFSENHFAQFGRGNENIEIFVVPLSMLHVIIPRTTGPCACEYGWAKTQQAHSSILQEYPANASRFRHGPVAYPLSMSSMSECKMFIQREKNYCCNSQPFQFDCVTTSESHPRHLQLVPQDSLSRLVGQLNTGYPRLNRFEWNRMRFFKTLI